MKHQNYINQIINQNDTKHFEDQVKKEFEEDSIFTTQIIKDQVEKELQEESISNAFEEKISIAFEEKKDSNNYFSNFLIGTGVIAAMLSGKFAYDYHTKYISNLSKCRLHFIETPEILKLADQNAKTTAITNAKNNALFLSACFRLLRTSFFVAENTNLLNSRTFVREESWQYGLFTGSVLLFGFSLWKIRNSKPKLTFEEELVALQTAKDTQRKQAEEDLRIRIEEIQARNRSERLDEARKLAVANKAILSRELERAIGKHEITIKQFKEKEFMDRETVAAYISTREKAATREQQRLEVRLQEANAAGDNKKAEEITKNIRTFGEHASQEIAKFKQNRQREADKVAAERRETLCAEEKQIEVLRRRLSDFDQIFDQGLLI